MEHNHNHYFQNVFRPYLHYSNALQDFDCSFHELLEFIQYNPVFIIIEAIGGMLKGKL